MPLVCARSMRLADEPFKDIRVRRALARATRLAEIFESNAFSLGQWVPNPIVPGAVGENITITGLDWSAVAPGGRMAFDGGAEVEITAYTTTLAMNYLTRGKFVLS